VRAGVTASMIFRDRREASLEAIFREADKMCGEHHGYLTSAEYCCKKMIGCTVGKGFTRRLSWRCRQPIGFVLIVQ
jgi:hypothetical protein